MKNKEAFLIMCENIRYLRQHHGLSRTAMAHKLHITRKTLDALELGELPEHISIAFLFHIWHEFGVSQKDMMRIRLADIPAEK